MTGASRRQQYGVLAGLLVLLVGAAVGVWWWRDADRAYCDEVAAGQEEIGRLMAEAGPAGALQALPHLEDLADDAPSDIADEWQILLTSLRGLDLAFEEAGVDPASYDPASVPAADRARIEAAAADLGSSRVRAAGQGVEQHALDVCKTPIGF